MESEIETRLDRALKGWVDARAEQSERSIAGGKSQEGNRSAVTAGKHLNAINQMIIDELALTGATNLTTQINPTLAGYFRSTKSWDLLVLEDEEPVLVIEYKSMSGSEGKNLNNRADEVFGIAADAKAAEEHGLLPARLRRAYVFVMAATDASTRQVKTQAAIGTVDGAFESASYMQRMAIMCERLRDEGLYHLAWAVGVYESPFKWFEPLSSVGWERFARDLHDAFPGGLPSPPRVS